MPSKKVHVRSYTVKAHDRVIHTRLYKFICQQCKNAVARESFGPRPLYCEVCRPPVSRSSEPVGRKKKPRPVNVRAARRKAS